MLKGNNMRINLSPNPSASASCLSLPLGLVAFVSATFFRLSLFFSLVALEALILLSRLVSQSLMLVFNIRNMVRVSRSVDNLPVCLFCLSRFACPVWFRLLRHSVYKGLLVSHLGVYLVLCGLRSSFLKCMQETSNLISLVTEGLVGSSEVMSSSLPSRFSFSVSLSAGVAYLVRFNTLVFWVSQSRLSQALLLWVDIQ